MFKRLNINVFLLFFFLVVALTSLSCATSTLLGYRKLVSDSQTELKQEADESVQAFESNMALYSQILYGGRGLLYSSQTLTRKEFNTFVSSLDLPRKAPGVSGMFYLEVVNDAQKTAFLARQQSANDLPVVDVSNLTIWPAAQKDRYLVATYAEPSNLSDIRNSLGFDFSSEPVRLAAFEQATQDNKATMTKPIIGAVNKAQIFVMLLPVYSQTQPTLTPAERTEAVTGAVALSFRSERLFNSAFDLFLKQHPNLQIMVYDGETLTPENLLYDSNVSKEVLGISTITSLRTEIRTVEAGNRTWTLTFTHPDATLTDSLFVIALTLSNLIIGPVSLFLAKHFFDLYRHS